MRCRKCGFDPWLGKIPWRRKWEPTPVFLPEKSHGQRSLAGCGPRGRKESDTTERAHTHTHTHTHTHVILNHLVHNTSVRIRWSECLVNCKNSTKVIIITMLIPNVTDLCKATLHKKQNFLFQASYGLLYVSTWNLLSRRVYSPLIAFTSNPHRFSYLHLSFVS